MTRRHQTAKNHSAKLCAAVLLTLAGNSRAATTVYDSGGFEAPRFTLNSNLAGQDPFTPWQKDGGASTAVVQTNNATGGFPQIQSVRMQRASGATGDTRWWAPAPVTPTASSPVVNVDFDMNVSISAVLTYGPLFGVEAYDSSGATPKLIGGLTLDGAQGSVAYDAAGSGAVTNTGTYLARNAYHHYTLSADFTSKTYSVFVDNALQHIESFVDSSASTFSYAPIFTAAAAATTETGTAYFDNYVVSQPAAVVTGAVWTNPAGGPWSVPTNWANASVADGADVIANFATLDLPGGPDVAVHLDSARTVGHLVFGDSDPSTASGWLIDAVGPLAKLTLSAPTSTPSITVQGLGGGKSVTIAAPIDGAEGLGKDGPGTLILSGDNTYTGATSAGAGKLVLTKSLTNSSAINASGGTIQLASDGTHNRVIKTAAVTATNGGQIDLADNKLIVTNGAATSDFAGTSYGGAAGLIASGYADGTWSGVGIVTSQSDAQSPSVRTALAFASADQLNRVGQVFAGQTLASGDLVVMYTYGGDANLDGTLNGDDYFQIDGHVNTPGASGWFNGDFDYNGRVNGDDYFVIDSNMNSQTLGVFPGVSSAAPPPSGVTAVPEPAVLALLAFAPAVAGRRRRVQSW